MKAYYRMKNIITDKEEEANEFIEERNSQFPNRNETVEDYTSVLRTQTFAEFAKQKEQSN